MLRSPLVQKIIKSLTEGVKKCRLLTVWSRALLNFDDIFLSIGVKIFPHFQIGFFQVADVAIHSKNGRAFIRLGNPGFELAAGLPVPYQFRYPFNIVVGAFADQIS